MPAYTITNTKLLNVLLLCLSLVKNRNVIILFFNRPMDDIRGFTRETFIEITPTLKVKNSEVLEIISLCSTYA